MSKKVLLWLGALLLVAFLLIPVAGCDTDEPAEEVDVEEPEEQEVTEPEEDEDETVDEEPGDPVELVMGHPFSGEHPVSRNILIPLAEDLERESNGRITLTIHPGGAITSPGSVYEDVVAGSFDIGWTLQGYTAGRYPLTEVVELPFLFESAKEGSEVLWQLFEESQDLQDEYGEVKVLGLWVTDPGDFLSKDPIREPGDLSGKRIRGAGAVQEAMLELFGATPVGMPAPEMYDGLERGTIDGVMIGQSVIGSYNMHEVIDYMTNNLNSFVSTQVVFMNSETWNSLSAADQELLDSLTGMRMATQGGEIYVSGKQRGFDLAEEAGVEIYEFTSEEIASWRELAEPVIENWISDKEGQGLPAQAIFDLLMSIIE